MPVSATTAQLSSTGNADQKWPLPSAHLESPIATIGWEASNRTTVLLKSRYLFPYLGKSYSSHCTASLPVTNLKQTVSAGEK